MITLAIDTTCGTCQTALTKDGIILGRYAENDRRTHSVKLLPAIEKIIKDAGLTPSDIDITAVTNGPGSYTGMRIGVSTAKAISYGTGAKLVGINTLDFLARSCAEGIIPDDAQAVCPLINARNERVYSCVYDKNLKRISEYEAGDLRSLCEKLKKYTSTVFCGDGAADYADIIKECLGDRAVFADSEVNLGKPETICKMAEKVYSEAEDKEIFGPERLEIEYLRSYLQEK